MCYCKKNGRLEQLLRNLEGFFEYVGSPQSGSRVSYSDIYEDLLTSLYQLDNNGNKVIIDLNTDIDRFVNDITAFDTANGTTVINDIPGGASSNMMYDEATHTISFNAVSATSNIRFILRKLTSGYLT